MTLHSLRRRRTLLTASLTGASLTLGSLWLTALPASAATTATFTSSAGLLSVVGDAADNTITVSRNAAGRILVNGGAVSVGGDVPTVANTDQIQISGVGGVDVLSVDETAGALPLALIFGGAGGDTLTGGSGADQLFGQGGDDTLFGLGGRDFLFGGDDVDTLDGGDGDDELSGEAGDDRLIWSPGDDSDIDEGGPGVDTVQVDGGNGAETFTAIRQAGRIRVDRVTPAPFRLDIGTIEKLVVNGNGGDDRITATGSLGAVDMTLDGGSGADILTGSERNDVLLGGEGADQVNGRGGTDVALLGGDADTVTWSPGGGSDSIEGQGGRDRLVLRGTDADETFTVSANGTRARVQRDLDLTSQDVNDLEVVVVRAAAGADDVVVADLDGTDVREVETEFAAAVGAASAERDDVRVDGTSGEDIITVNGTATRRTVTGLTSSVVVRRPSTAPAARLVVDGQEGADVVNASELVDPAGLRIEGGSGEDVVIGSSGDDRLLGGAHDDVLVGGPGDDVLDGGTGTNVLVP